VFKCLAPSFKKAEFDIMYNESISKEGNSIDIGIQEELVHKDVSWFSYKIQDINFFNLLVKAL